MTWEIEELLKASENSQRCQRNYDLSREIPEYDLRALAQIVANSPSKQNEKHIGLAVVTNKNIIQQLYNKTKTVILKPNNLSIEDVCDNSGEKWEQDQRYVIENSQVLASAVFVFYKDVDGTYLEAGDSIFAMKEDAPDYTLHMFGRQVFTSMGIAIGEFLLAAHLMGYKTGCCAAFRQNEIAEILSLSEKKVPYVMVGLGYHNPNLNRRASPTLKNKNVHPDRRTGSDEENWLYPTHDKPTEILFYE